MFLAIWNAFWTPLTIGFDHAKTLNDTDWSLRVINAVVDIMFWLDIFVGFVTSYVDPASGDEIFDIRRIAIYYVTKGTFLIDFLSTFPFGPVFKLMNLTEPVYDNFASFISLLKAFRISKIKKKISDSTFPSATKAILQVVFYGFTILVYTHIVGCIMWRFLRTDAIWIPAVDFGAVDAKVHYDFRLNEKGEEVGMTKNEVLLYQWLTAWYNSAISFALVEVNARSSS